MATHTTSFGENREGCISMHAVAVLTPTFHLCFNRTSEKQKTYSIEQQNKFTQFT
jgi:hypothetical protein